MGASELINGCLILDSNCLLAGMKCSKEIIQCIQ